jgi:cation diffusion facilitator family transporter
MHDHTHHHPNPRDARYREVRKVTLIGSIVDLLLGIIKVVIGYLSHSQALVADGIHSFSDLFTDFLVLFAAKHAHRAADEEHPYGHGRIETVATVALGGALLTVAVGISYDAIRRLMEPELLLHPGVLALLAALVSVLAKEIIYQYTVRVARRLRSRMLHANAWHSRSDAISSIVVVIGVGGTMAGLPWLDAVAAIVVALMIAKIAWDLLWKSLQELIDTALDAEQVEAISENIRHVPGVRSLHMLRTRRSGSDALVDVHILVDPRLSVSEGHQIGETVRNRLLQDNDEVTDVTVHIDPEDDEMASPCTHLPLWDEILRRLEDRWQGLAPLPQVEKVVLHYLDGKVHVDLYLPMMTGTAEELDARACVIREAARQAEDVGEVRVYFR